MRPQVNPLVKLHVKPCVKPDVERYSCTSVILKLGGKTERTKRTKRTKLLIEGHTKPVTVSANVTFVPFGGTWNTRMVPASVPEIWQSVQTMCVCANVWLLLYMNILLWFL